MTGYPQAVVCVLPQSDCDYEVGGLDGCPSRLEQSTNVTTHTCSSSSTSSAFSASASQTSYSYSSSNFNFEFSNAEFNIPITNDHTYEPAFVGACERMCRAYSLCSDINVFANDAL